MLGYSRPSAERFVDPHPVLVAKLLAGPVVLTMGGVLVIGSAASDADVFGYNFWQTLLYAVMSPLLILSWIAWAGWVLMGILRRRLSLLVALPLALLGAWGGLISAALYATTAEFIDQTTRFQGASWPLMEKIFR